MLQGLRTDHSTQPLPLNRAVWRLVGRDAALLYLLTFWGGVVLGLAGFSPTPTNVTLFIVVSAILLVIGFTISGFATRYERRRYLPMVAASLWLLCSANVPLGFDSFSAWLSSLVAYLLYSALGGGMASILARCTRPAIPESHHRPA
jgi:hypothetical protein